MYRAKFKKINLKQQVQLFHSEIAEHRIKADLKLKGLGLGRSVETCLQISEKLCHERGLS